MCVGLCEDRVGEGHLVISLEQLAWLLVLLTKNKSVFVIRQREGLNVERDNSLMALRRPVSLYRNFEMVEYNQTVVLSIQMSYRDSLEVVENAHTVTSPDDSRRWEVVQVKFVVVVVLDEEFEFIHLLLAEFF